MADSVTIKLEGAEAILRKLETLEPRVAKKHLKKALRVGAKIILAATKRKAPVLSGNLKRSLSVRNSKRRRGRHEGGVTVLTDTKKVPELITFGKDGKRAFYPAVIEYGSRHRRARPFMRPAFDAEKRNALDASMKSLRDSVEMEAAK